MLEPHDSEAQALRLYQLTDARPCHYRLRPRESAEAGYADHDATSYLPSDNAKAVRDDDVALRIDSKPRRTYTNRAAAYEKLEQLAKSLAGDNDAIARDPKVPEYLDNRGLT